MLKLALIGIGRWGKNILRTLESMRGVDVVAYDLTTSPQPSPHLRRGGVDGVIIATPGSTHAEIAFPYIKQGLPVYIEKPMTISLPDAQRLQKAAKKSGSEIFVGHVHMYNPAYLKLKELLPKIGKIQLISFEGMASGPVRDDMSVLWDWGPHGVSLALDLLGKRPTNVQAWGHKILKSKSKLHDVVQARMIFPGKVEATLSLSWISAEKRVKLTVIGAKGSLILDDTAEQKVTLSVDDKVTHPSYSADFPLTRELTAFVKMVKTGERPKTSAQNGVDVVRVLAAAEKSLGLDGKKVQA